MPPLRRRCFVAVVLVAASLMLAVLAAGFLLASPVLACAALLGYLPTRPQAE